MSNARKTIAAIGAATLLAACGGDDDSGFADQPAREIVAAAEADMKALTSMRMAGDLVIDGEELSIDMAMDIDGDCEGSLGQGGATAQVISVEGASYMKPDAAFWEGMAGDASGQIAELVGDRWVEVPAEQGSFSEFCDLDELLGEIGGDDVDEDAEVEGTEEIAGQEAVRLSTTSDDDEPVTVWVTVDEPHVILQMEVTEGDDPGLLTFSDFDQDLQVEAPPADETVDLNELGG